ncbi:MAG TPA: Asp-tRNA(Asn)/Glu-tRNA(Gln) amidotransferase subunit GatC [bacterium]|nr:Asp-tRNA(Asn)/Glu-tRNA(Gln) amidotransferase subunit GatC [bacterium]
MAITRKDVSDVAILSRLKMSPEELDKFTDQLGNILEYASMLNELDLTGVEPTSHVIPMKNVFREDEVKESYPVEKVLANAPEALGDFFLVPKVIDEGEGH